MVFPSIEFALFFPVVLAASWLLMPRPHIWKPFILTCSYLFYAAADPKFCLLLAGVTVGNQVCARMVVAAGENRVLAKRWVAGGVALNLLVLGIFKYYGFFAENVDDVLGTFSLSPGIPLLSLALPIGLSFFTFQAISYVVDVYRGDAKLTNVVNLGLYLSFFPHLVAGPIVRASEFLPQLESPRNPRDVPVGPAVLLICLGLIKKVAIADLLARNVVDPVFAVPEAYGAPDVWLAVYAYAAQIYCDFSGYTDIAIGLALLMGIRFPPNFDRPYRSLSIQEFWRRWHMTLSRYLRDYLYIGLGGNRKGEWKTARNLFLTMLLGGLWHGAAWGFVLWGGIHGSVLVIERVLRRRFEYRLPSWAGWFITFHIAVLAWVPFRSPDLGLAGSIFKQLFVAGDLTLLTPGVAVGVLTVIGFQLLPVAWWERLRGIIENLPAPALGAALAVTIIVVGATVPSQGVPPFIYFAF